MPGSVTEIGGPGAWERFWFAPMDATPLKWIRVGSATIALLYALELAPLLSTYYVDGGRFPIAEARAGVQGQAISLLFPPAFGNVWVVYLLYVLLLGSLGSLTAGWRVRLTAPIAYMLLLWFQLRMPLYLDGGDQVLQFSLLYLAVSGLVFPMELGRGGSGPVPAWTLRLYQIQVALLYLLSGYWKVTGSAWWDGSAVYVAIANPSFSRFELPGWLIVEPLFMVAGVAVAWWEFLFPALVAFGRSRIPALLFGVALHLGILLTMNIGLFSLAVLVTYPAFLSEDRRALDWMRRSLPGALA